MAARWWPGGIGQQIRFEHLNAIDCIKSVGLATKLTTGFHCALFGKDTVHFLLSQHAQNIGNLEA